MSNGYYATGSRGRRAFYDSEGEHSVLDVSSDEEDLVDDRAAMQLKLAQQTEQVKRIMRHRCEAERAQLFARHPKMKDAWQTAAAWPHSMLLGVQRVLARDAVSKLQRFGYQFDRARNCMTFLLYEDAPYRDVDFSRGAAVDTLHPDVLVHLYVTHVPPRAASPKKTASPKKRKPTTSRPKLLGKGKR